MKKQNNDEVAGRITVHPAGYGFVTVDDASEDVFVPAKYRGNALDGDEVLLATWEGYKGTEGRVLRVLSRGRARLTGVLRIDGRNAYLEPDDPRIATDFGSVPLEGSAKSVLAVKDARPGCAIVAEISSYPDGRDEKMRARIAQVLGDPEDPATEIAKIIACEDIPIDFPGEAVHQAQATSQTVTEADLVDRIDLRDRDFITIDPVTARDFDDALCLEQREGGGTRVWVAVADVSHYVKPGDALDREAVVRGVSVYLPDRVIPMLPFELSSGICSLNPDVDRCAMVARLDFDTKNELIATDFAAAVIRSRARLDYDGVAAALSGDLRGSRKRYEVWLPTLKKLQAIAKALRKKRNQRGALDLDIPEAKVIMDADDPRLVRDVVRGRQTTEITAAYQLIEDFMVAANEAVGAFFFDRDAATVWRVHPTPRKMKLEQLAILLATYGIKLNVDEASTPRGLKRVVDALGDLNAGHSLMFQVLRSLKQASYQVENLGHFALASPMYLHFTSPIRRYPDVLVHRLLKYYLRREGKPAGGPAAKPLGEAELTELCTSCSAHERRALDAEREAVAMYRAYLLRSHVGDRFPATISGVTNFGIFVELDEPFVDGRIKFENLGADHFEFHPERMQLIGRRTGAIFRLGARLEVELVAVSVQQRRIEFRVVTDASELGWATGERRRKRRRRRYDEESPRNKTSRGKKRSPREAKSARPGKRKGAASPGKKRRRSRK